MIFDFHTHIFPDKIAPRTIQILKQNIVDIQHCEEPEAYTDGTLSGLKESMHKNGVDYSLVLPIATTTKQSETINNFAASINGKDNIFSFGSIHPLQENAIEELERIKSLGLCGIKLHPEYQGVYINQKESEAVLKKCAELNLVVAIHAGRDIGMLPPIKSSPQMIYDVLQRVPDVKLVAAHMGSWKLWDDVEKYLVGTSVYFDTSFSFDFMAKEQFISIIKNHKNIVFGTDSPWGNQKESIEDILSCGFDEEFLNKIMYKNAWDLLFG